MTGEKAHPLTILVVEDNAVMMKLVTKQLTHLGFTAETASNGEQALDRLKKNSYDIVLMDVQMPVMDGLEATRKIRESEQGSKKHMVVIALTGYASRTDCLAAGMDDFIAKPMNIATLKGALDRWVDRAGCST